MEIQNTQYDKHIIGDSIALSFDNFYSEIDTLKENCPKPFRYPEYNDYYIKQSEWAFDVQWDTTKRILPIPIIEEKLFPRLVPVSPAGPVSKIVNAEYSIIETLNPIIKTVYNKDISEAKIQNVSSCDTDYILHIDAHNIHGDDYLTAYYDEMKDDRSVSGINWKEADLFEKTKKELKDKEKYPTTDELDTLYNPVNTCVNSEPLFIEDIFTKWLPKSKRMKLQNHPTRPQWGEEGTFICLTFLQLNDKEIPNVEFWKHKPFVKAIDGKIDDEQLNIYSMKQKYLTNMLYITQLLYYESWQYGGHYENIVLNHSIPTRRMALSQQVIDKWHALNDYDLVNAIPGAINKCVMFPAEYFNKISFEHQWYTNEQLLTQVMVLK